MRNDQYHLPQTISPHSMPLEPSMSRANYPIKTGEPATSYPPHTTTHLYSNFNYLIASATSLITLITQIRYTIDHPNVPIFRSQVIEEIKTVISKLTQSCHYQHDIILSAQYCLCTAIDEAVLSRPWGSNSIWAQESLLSLFHKETWGGENFYIVLEQMLPHLPRSIDLLELIYYLLSLGYEGKYYGTNHKAAREEIRNRLFHSIRRTRNKPERTLSITGMIDKLPISTKQKKSKIKKYAIITAASLVILSLIFNIQIYNKAKPTLKKLTQIGTISPITKFSQVIQRPTVLRENKRMKK